MFSLLQESQRILNYDSFKVTEAEALAEEMMPYPLLLSLCPLLYAPCALLLALRSMRGFQTLGWHASISLREGLKQTYRWYL
jgi:nucleoside-diphosphate-sugar epimerase